jgi:hypothetical protein
METTNTEGMFFSFKYISGGPGSVVGITTAYGLDGTGIESQ